MKLKDNRKRLAELLAHVWKTLAQRHGHLFTANFGTQWESNTEWQRAIGELTEAQLFAGMKAVQRGELQPLTLDKLLELCGEATGNGVASKDDIRQNIFRWRSIEREQKLPEALWMIRYSKAQWEWMLHDNQRGQREFNRCYRALQAHLDAGGELPELPKETLKIESKPLPKDELLDGLDAILASMKGGAA
ncbi:hypothetical protein KRX19_05680 [Cardiobacteriaceae bacterium TAE3-ERU3]|nr:hypothetical protein [Cardiobacteriaceae bacterium TAE3-ERU3]